MRCYAGLSIVVWVFLIGSKQARSPVIGPSSVTIRTAERRQPIYGFGGTQTYNGDPLAEFKNRDAVYRALFSDLKLDILRLRNYHDYPGQQAAFERRTKEFASGALRWGSAKQRGGKLPVRLMFTSWSPPPRLKSNNLVSGKSDGTDKGLDNVTLKRSADGKYVYAEFADWWLDSLRTFKRLTSVYPDYIALQNELDIAVSYEGCELLPSEGTGKGGAQFAGYDRALAAVTNRLNIGLGKDAPRILGPETFTIRTGSDGRSQPLQFVDPASDEGKTNLSRLFGVSFHIYGSGVESADPAQFHRYLADMRQKYLPDWKGRPLFQTEFIHGPSLTALASQIHDCFTIGGVSAYFVWILARGVHQPGFALVYYNTQDGSVERRERFYAVKHFSAFVGEGWTRVENSCDDSDIKVSSYIGPGDRELSVVLINPTRTERRVKLEPEGGFSAAMIYRSTEGEDGEKWRELGALPPDHMVTLPPRSVATVHYSVSK